MNMLTKVLQDERVLPYEIALVVYEYDPDKEEYSPRIAAKAMVLAQSAEQAKENYLAKNQVDHSEFEVFVRPFA
jgi:hypothetical protein